MSVGRNDPCPCGSGRKFKVCHGSAAAGSPGPGAHPGAALLKQALQRLEHGEHARAADLCRRILEDNPEQAEARHYLGMALCFAGKPDDGIPHIRASLLLRPAPPVEHNRAVFHNNLALWLEKTGDLDGAEEHYKDALNTKPDYHQARFNLAKLLMQRLKHHLAKILLQELLAVDPDNPELRGRLAESHYLLREYSAMEREYRALIARSPRPGPLHLNLGNNLRDIGRYDEARAEFEAVLAGDAGNLEAITGIARIEEMRNRIEESEQWTGRGLALDPNDAALHLNIARLRRRQGRLDEALKWLDGIPESRQDETLSHEISRERGMVLDKQKRWDDAFDAFQRANDRQRKELEQRVGRVFYDKNRHHAIFAERKAFFTRAQLAALKPFLPPAPEPAPIFIVGFPRSGTTLLEQMLGAHPRIHAGDELQGVTLLANFAAKQLLGSWEAYPACLAEITEPGKQDGLLRLRDYYLGIAREQQAIPADKPRFTDKMPLNEDSLGLIRLILPESPIIHVVRHPLDVILSCYFNQLTHGDNCALTLDTLAFHYQGVWDLAEHYVAEMDLRYTRIRYEDLLADPEREMRRLFEFLGEPWEPRCLEFHKTKRVARTASYAQVNQPLYRTSQERWRPYRKHLEPIIPELTPLIEKLGYSVD